MENKKRPTVALCVSGGIAAYKAVHVARLLRQAGYAVRPLMTRSAERFVGTATLAAVCATPVADDIWDPTIGGEAHITIADEADVIAVVPATADLLARMAQGRADDLVAALLLCARSPMVVAPAMHPRMWAHPATQRNVEFLSQQASSSGRLHWVGPVYGPVANGDVGVGRMAEPEAIFETIVSVLERRPARALELAGKHVVVTAGPTVEDLDPVRFLGNRSSGKMGFAVATDAAARGARVTLIAGPVTLPTPAAVERVDVRTTADLARALDAALGADLRGADALVMAAAVADWRPAQVDAHKDKKTGAETERTLHLLRNDDLLATIGRRRGGAQRPVLFGFCVETEDLAAHAARKRAAKQVDLIVANLAADGFAGDRNRGLLMDADGARPFDGTKREVAAQIIDALVARLAHA